MADISKLNLNGTTYNLKDAEARSLISDLPQPMVFKGTLGDGGTISSLPTASTSNIGNTYKVITDGTYDSKVAYDGDMFICNDTPEWVLIPSGDEIGGGGTVTNIATGTGLSGGPITTSGTISVNFNEVQATISDLATIRSGATAGATALQSGADISELTNDSGYLVTSDFKTINNNSVVGSGNILVQETLVSGTNIKTINNISLLGSGNIDLASYVTLFSTDDNNGRVVLSVGPSDAIDADTTNY